MLFVITIPNKHNHAVIRIDYEDSLSFVFLSLLDGPRPSAFSGEDVSFQRPAL